MPCGCPGRMRQRHHIHPTPPHLNRELPPNHSAQFLHLHKLPDRQLANRDHQFGTQQIQLPLQPPRTVPDLHRVRHTITARRILSRKTATHSRHVHTRAKLLLANAACALEPPKQRLPSGPREGPSNHGFPVSGCLPDRHHPAENRPAGNRRAVHSWTKRTRPQFAHQFLKQPLGTPAHNPPSKVPTGTGCPSTKSLAAMRFFPSS